MKKLVFAICITLALFGAFSSIKEKQVHDSKRYDWTDEDEAQIRDLIVMADTKYNKVAGVGLKKSSYSIKVNGVKYYAVVEHFVKSMDGLWKYIAETFVDPSNVFSDIVDGKNGIKPRYIAKDGRLYSLGRSTPLYDIENIKDVKIIRSEKTEENIKLWARIDYFYYSKIAEVWKDETGYKLKNCEVETLDEVNGEKHIVSENDGLLTFDSSSLATTDVLSDNELKEIFIPLFNRSITVYQLINNSPSWVNTVGSATLAYGSYVYFEVDSPEVDSISDMWELAKSVFTSDACHRLFKNSLDEFSNEPRYIEKDGRLYCRIEGYGRNIDYNFDTFEVAAQYENVALVSLDDTCGATTYFIMQKTPTGWKLENFEGESYDFVLNPSDAKSVVSNLLSKVNDVWRRLVLCDFKISDKTTNKYGYTYYKINDKDFKSLQDIKDYFHSAFHSSVFDSLLLNPLIAPENSTPKYIEHNNALWCLEPIPCEGDVTLDVTDVVVHKNKIDFLYVTAKTPLDTIKMEIIKENGEWLFYHTYTLGYEVATTDTCIVRTNSRGLTYSTSYLKDTAYELDTSEVISIFTPLINRARLVNSFIFSPTLREDMRVDSAFLTDDKSVLSLATTVYAQETITRLVNPLVKGNNSAYYKNDEVYYYKGSIAEKKDIEYLFDTLEIVKQKKDFVLLKVDRLVDGVLEKNIVFSLYCTNDGWRLLNGEDEKYPDLIFYDKFYLAGYSSSTTFATISLPEVTLDDMTYVPNERTDAEDFDFGDWVPFVSYDVKQYSRHSNVYRLAFLNENTKSFNDGYELWKKLNSKWLVTYPYVQLGDLQENTILSEFLFESKITYISSDGNTLGRIKYICDGVGDYGEQNYTSADWRAEYDVIENGQVTKTINSTDYWHYQDILRDSTIKTISAFEKQYEYIPSLDNNGFEDSFIECDSNRLAYSHVENGVITYRIYSLDSRQVLFEVQLPCYEDDFAYIETLIDDRLLLINRNVLIYADEEASNYYQAVYIYDLKTGELSLAEDFAECPQLSPDGKFLLYTEPYWDSFYSSLSGWDEADIGIYIKNLENGKTVFYPIETIEETTYHSGRKEFISWVKRDAFEELIK